MALPQVVRVLVDTSVDAVVVVGLDLQVLYFNSAYLHLTGLRVRNLRDPSMRGLCHEHFGLDTCDEECVAQRVINGGKAIRVDEVTSETRSLRLIVVAVPLLDDQGVIYGVLESYRDVTAESRLQNEYRRLLDLERADKRRLARDAAVQLGQRNDELRETNRQLERANSAKRRFLASMSHEIRTPLAGVLGIAQLLASTDLDASQQQLVQTLCNSGDALLALISDVLDFSKIEAERLELEHTAFSVRSVVDSAALVFSSQAQSRGVEFVVLADPKLPDSYMGDPQRIRQILLNLCSNAVKFTSAGQVVLRVEADHERVGNVVFSVSDTGIGIPKDRRFRLFQAFSQVDDSTTREYGGTGLGLAISRRLSEMMGGTIWLESKEGVGSTFSLSLPLDRAKSSERAPTSERTLALCADVVDSNPLRRKSLVAALLHLGVSANGHESIRSVPHEGSCDGKRAVVVALPVAADDERLVQDLREVDGVALVAVASLAERTKFKDDDDWSAFLTRPTHSGQVAELVSGLVRSGGAEVTEIVTSEAVLVELRRKYCVLIVEDSAVNRMILSLALRKAGYRIEEAHHGAQAVEACEDRDFDVVLMDCQMPVMDGFEATRRIRAYERGLGRQVPIVALTANVTVADRRACRNAGMDGYLTKPFMLVDILEELDKRILGLRDRAAG